MTFIAVFGKRPNYTYLSSLLMQIDCGNFVRIAHTESIIVSKFLIFAV